MKTSTLLKLVVVVALFAISTSGLLAQSITAKAPLWTGSIATSAFADSSSEIGLPKQETNIDTVTVGSVMPYYVKGDLKVHMLRQWGAITAKSTYSWTLDGATSTSIKQTLSSDSLVSVSWSTAGNYVLGVTEVPGAKATGYPDLCTVIPYSMNVKVLPRPTAAWYTAAVGDPAVAGGCGQNGNTIKIPVNLKGIGEWDIKYTVQYFDLSNTETVVPGITRDGTATAVTYGAIGDKNDVTAQTNVELLSITIPADKALGDYGKYVITITDIKDRISKKSGVDCVTTTDIPTSPYVVYSLPVPTTQPIQHIKNL